MKQDLSGTIEPVGGDRTRIGPAFEIDDFAIVSALEFLASKMFQLEQSIPDNHLHTLAMLWPNGSASQGDT